MDEQYTGISVNWKQLSARRQRETLVPEVQQFWRVASLVPTDAFPVSALASDVTAAFRRCSNKLWCLTNVKSTQL